MEDETLELVDTFGIYGVYANEFKAVVVDATEKPIKTYTGENAWSDAQRYASDLMFKEMYG
jgi:hypothetical protein